MLSRTRAGVAASFSDRARQCASRPSCLLRSTAPAGMRSFGLAKILSDIERERCDASPQVLGISRLGWFVPSGQTGCSSGSNEVVNRGRIGAPGLMPRLAESRPLFNRNSADESNPTLSIRPKDHRFSIGDGGSPIGKRTRQVWLTPCMLWPPSPSSFTLVAESSPASLTVSSAR